MFVPSAEMPMAATLVATRVPDRVMITVSSVTGE